MSQFRLSAALRVSRRRLQKPSSRPREVWPFLFRHHNNTLRRVPLIVIAAVIIASAIYSPFVSAKTLSDMTPTEEMKSWVYYNALAYCIDNRPLKDTSGIWPGIHNRISEKNAMAGTYFYTESGSTNPNIADFLKAESISVTSDKGEGVLCDDAGGWVLDAARLWGYTDGIDLLCDMGAQRTNGTHCRTSDGGSGEFKGERAVAVKTGGSSTFTGADWLGLDTFRNNIKNRIYGGKDPTYGDAAHYVLARDAFFTGCLNLGTGSGLTVPTAYSGTAPDDSFTFNGVKIVDPTNGMIANSGNGLKLYGNKKKTDKVSYYVGTDLSNKSDTCQSLVDQINQYAGAYSSWIQMNPTNPDQTGSSKCQSSNDPACNTTQQTTCGISGVGWIVCPVTSFLGDITDSAFTFLADSFLKTNPSVVETTDGNGNVASTYAAWGAMRSFANIAFVIVFLVIIFSQLTGVGLTNYGVKKMLPRLIVAAVLINISFYICAVAVDLSNILGYSLKSLFDGFASSSLITGPNVPEAGNQGWGIAALAGGLLVTGVTAIFAVTVPVLLAVLLAVLMIVITLVARNALIVLLVVVSPLAFVAYLLPNTEQWFKKWTKLFSSLLLLFPMIGLVFGASSLAAKVIYNGDTSDTAKLLSIAVAALPLFVVPGMLKGALNSAGKIGAKMSGWTQRAANKVPGKVRDTSRLGDYQKYRQNLRANRRAQINAGTFRGSNRNPLNWGRNASSIVNRGVNGVIPSQFGNKSMATGVAAADKAREEEIQRQMVLDSTDLPGRPHMDAAAHMARLKSGKGTREEIVSSLRSIGKTGTLTQVQEAMASAPAGYEREVETIGMSRFGSTEASVINSKVFEDQVSTAMIKNRADSISADEHLRRAGNAGLSDAERTASIRALGEVGGMGQINALASMTNKTTGVPMSDALRQEAVSVAAKKTDKNPAFGGVQLKNMGEGTFVDKDAYKAYATNEAFNGQALLGMDQSSRDELLKVIGSTPAGSPERVHLQGIANDLTKPGAAPSGVTDELLAKILANV